MFLYNIILVRYPGSNKLALLWEVEWIPYSTVLSSVPVAGNFGCLSQEDM